MKQVKQIKKESMAANLCDDFVLEIILRLPLKYAIQCKILNKNLNHYISHPTFKHKHALLSSTQINNTILFYSSIYSPKIFRKFTRKSEKALPLCVSVLASCNGLLFLSIECYSKSFVFNPITGQVLAIDHRMKDADVSLSGPPGLVVDNKATFDHPFKLVMTNKTRYNKLRFEVIVPSGSSTSLKSGVDFVCHTFTWLRDKKTRPVYLNGALHWLGVDLSEILVFDLDKEHVKIIKGPIKKGSTSFRGYIIAAHGLLSIGPRMWFGLAQGLLSFIYTSKEEITIHAHDYGNDEWQIRHRIANIIDPRNYDDNITSGIPVYFDGQNILFQLEKRGKDETVYLHNISSKRWEKKGVAGGCKWDPLLLYIPFLPTLAKVFDDDHPHKNYKVLSRSKDGQIMIVFDDLHKDTDLVKIKRFSYECLLELQQFLRDH